nr:putative reverse transcriptase domain-containing protein [Tanacetum cinerariifolium]
MSPPTCKKFHWGIVFPTGLKHYKDPEMGLKIAQTNHKCRITNDLYPYRIEEKLIMRKLEGKWTMKKEIRMISKDGIISEFPGYTSSKEAKEEEEEEDKKEESKKKGSKETSEMGSNSESSGYAASDNEIITQVTNNVNIANANGRNGGNGRNGNGGNNKCSYKAFLACNPQDYDGKGGAVALTRWIEKTNWWNTQVQARGREAAIGMTWVEFKSLLMEEFCPSNEMEKLESHFARDYHAPVKQVALVSAVRMGNNQRVCYEFGSFEHLLNTCLKLNRAPGQAKSRLALEGNRNTQNNKNQARGRAFSVNAVDAFIVSPGYVMEVANGKKEEVDKIIHDCKLELGDSLFTIDLILLGHGSFDVVGIPLEGGEILRIQRERTLGGTKTLMSMRADEPGLSEIPVTKEDYEVHLKLVLELLKKERLYAKFSMCKFWLQEIELFRDYECEIRYHPGKANVVADALSRKERVKPRRVQAMAMNIQSGVKRMILGTHSEAFKEENMLAERLHRLDQQIERKEDESLYFMDHIRVSLVGGVRTIILDEAHKTRYYVHSGADKMYHDLRDMYWCPGIKRDIATYVSK